MIHTQAKKWKTIINNYVINRPKTHPLLVVRYEDLKQDAVKEVQRMLDFLNVPLQEDELVAKLHSTQFDQFHRNHSASATFDPYTKQQVNYLNSVIIETENTLLSKGITDFIPLRTYVRKIKVK